MDGINIVLASNAQNVFDIQISIGRALALAYLISLVSLVTVQGKGIFFGIYSNGANA